VDAEVTWTGDAFAFKSLERYDAQGHPYIYTVEETGVTGYELSREEGDGVYYYKVTEDG